jgi:antirestriction protein ArdC
MSRHAAARTSTRERARSGESRVPVARASLYQEITNKIVSQLEAGCVPWVQAWSYTNSAALGLPKNAATGRLIPAASSGDSRGIPRCR